MSKDVNLIKEILVLMEQGYSIKEVVEEIPHLDQDKFYSLVKSVFTKAKEKMTKEELDDLKTKQSARAQQLKDEKKQTIVNQVKDRLAQMPKDTMNQKEYFNNVIRSVALLKGLDIYTVKDYFKEVAPDLYSYYIDEKYLDEKYFLEQANQIINKKMSKSLASKIYGFSKLMIFLEEKYPDLYNQIIEIFNSKPKKSIERINQNPYQKIIVAAKLNKLFRIIMEFRVPLNKVCEFINKNASEFLNNPEQLIDEPTLQNILLNLPSIYNDDAVGYYFDNIATNSAFSKFKIERFDKFADMYTSLKGNDDYQNKLYRYETLIDLNSVLEKVAKRVEGQQFYFTIEEKRNILKYACAYGLTLTNLGRILGLAQTRKEPLISEIKDSEMPMDQCLVEDFLNLVEFNDRKFLSYGPFYKR